MWGHSPPIIPFLKSYTGFNVEQIDDLPAHYDATPEPKGEPLQLLAHAECFFVAPGAVLRHGGTSMGPLRLALLSPMADT
jgi:antirestriction protein ArdC